ncbi:MAG: DUF2070 family protein [Candidatus Diapherotrites archaeon]|nr:DUF2070 family protein [Candidatus Diapherotrites archaeon]
MENDIENYEQTVGLTKYLFSIPKTSITLLLTFLSSVFFAVFSQFFLVFGFNPDFSLSLDSVSRIIVDGTFNGFVLLFVPALFAGILTPFFSRHGKKFVKIYRSMFLAFFCSTFIGVLMLAGSILNPWLNVSMIGFLILGYSVIFAFRALVIHSTVNLKFPFVLVPSSLQTVAGLALIAFAMSVNLAPAFVVAVSLETLIIKTILVTSVFVTLVFLFIAVVDAPMKRNFGVSAIEAFSLFLSAWADNSIELESLFHKIGQEVTTTMGIISFESSKKIKGIFLVPAIHPGPFGGTGGARMPFLLSRKLSKATGADVFVMHGPATHDFNPVSSKEINKFFTAAMDTLPNLEKVSSATVMKKFKTGLSTFSVQAFGNNYFFASTLSPKPTEDVDLNTGIAVSSVAKAAGAKDAIFADAHNCHQVGDFIILSGSPVGFDMMGNAKKSVDNLLSVKQKPVKFGSFVSRQNKKFESDFGSAGASLAVVDTGGQKSVYVLFDGNNLQLGLREKLIGVLKSKGAADAEIMTTDSHSVNTIKGVENPVGSVTGHEVLSEWVAEAFDRAVLALDPVKVGFSLEVVPHVQVIGSTKTQSMVSTINSIVAVSKILAPVILVLSFMLAFFLFL